MSYGISIDCSSSSSGITVIGNLGDDEDKIKVKKLDENAIIPNKANPGDAGFDLYSLSFKTINPGKAEMVNTGIAMSFPQNLYGKIEEKSGIASKTPLSLKAGVVDSGYQGEIKIVIFNHGKEPYTITPGSPIAQLIIHKHVYESSLKEVESFENESERGDKGFGSSYFINEQ